LKKHLISIILLSSLFVYFDSHSMKRKRQETKNPNNQPIKRQQMDHHDIEDLSEKLIDKMQQLMIERQASNNDLINAMRSRDHKQVLNLLENEYAFLGESNALKAGIMRWALMNDFDDIIQLIINRGINLRGHSQLTKQVLLRACVCGYENTVCNLLLNSDIQIDAQDRDGHNPLIKAIMFNHPAIINMLLMYTPSDQRTRRNMITTARDWAMMHGLSNTVNKLNNESHREF